MPVETAPPLRVDPIPTFRFYVEIEGIIEGMFIECSGLGVQRKVFEYKEGGVNDYTHQLPDQVKYSNIKLQRGLGTLELFNWFMEGVRDGKVRYTNISIIVLGHDNGKGERQVIRRWNLDRAYPIKWTGPSLKTDSKQIAIEALEIVHHGLTLGQNEQPSGNV